MTKDEAYTVLREVDRCINFVNFGGTVQKFSNGFSWKTFDNSVWRYDPEKALLDVIWLKDHIDEINTAIQLLKDERNK